MNSKTVYGLENEFDGDAEPTVPTQNMEKRSTLEEPNSLGNINPKNKYPPCDDDVEYVDFTGDFVYELSDNEQGEATWKKYIPADLKKPITPNLKNFENYSMPESSKRRNNDEEANDSIVTPQTKRSKSLSVSRRRPTMQVKALTRSAIAEKYDQLLDRRLEIAEFQNKKLAEELLSIEKMNSGFITQLEPPVSPEKSVSLVVIKNESPESEIMESGMDNIFNTSDSKDIDIVYHPLRDDSIKSETISKNILETVHVKTENVKIENIIESEILIKTEDTSDDNGRKVVEVQGNLETDEQQVLTFSNDLNAISVRSPKRKHPEKTYFADRRTRETTSLEEIKGKIKVVKTPSIPVKSHEYLTLAKNKHVCNHCQLTSKTLNTLKYHIRTKHREVTTMHQCLYCSFKSKWRTSVQKHIHKHRGTRDNLQYHYCDKCDFKTYHTGSLKTHKLIHLKPEEIQYFYCQHCSYKSKYNQNLKDHVLRHFENVENEQNLKRYHCDTCHYKTYKYLHLKRHKLVHLKPEEIEYLYCYHCSYKSRQKFNLRIHIFRHHFKNAKQEKRHHCGKCDYETYRTGDLNRHKLTHLKPEDIPYFHCYHCSYKSREKMALKRHIFKHLKKGEVKFDCYICNFMTQKRELIIEHIKKHSKVQIKFEINEGN